MLGVSTDDPALALEASARPFPGHDTLPRRACLLLQARSYNKWLSGHCRRSRLRTSRTTEETFAKNSRAMSACDLGETIILGTHRPIALDQQACDQRCTFAPRSAKAGS